MTDQKIKALLERGVKIPNPQSLEIGEDVNPSQIHPSVTLHSGCRLFGAATSIGPDSVLGHEAPVTLEDCQLGKGVDLKGGYFSNAVFLDGSNMGSCAHVRGGTLFEEQASGAHSVGCKQTILLPFVTLGSLINFCDVLMAGGTSRKDHSEVGSSYIHFNFTPQQDKATASLLGDVPRGVMLDQRPIFLGGQGGMVGPVRVNYGCVTGAGTIVRKDILDEDRLVASPGPTLDSPTGPAVYKSIQRKLINNLHYLGNLLALEAWYQVIRRPFMSSDPFSQACFQGALKNLDGAIKERLKRMTAFVEKLPHSVKHWQAENKNIFIPDQERLVHKWPEMAEKIETLRAQGVSHPGIETLKSAIAGDDYLDAIRALEPAVKKAGSDWLRVFVDHVAGLWD